jgi:hypothetical protein
MRPNSVFVCKGERAGASVAKSVSADLRSPSSAIFPVGGFLLLQIFLQQVGAVIAAELLRPADQRITYRIFRTEDYRAKARECEERAE